MKRTSNLPSRHQDLLHRAQKLAKNSYKESLTSMAAVLKTKKGNYYTGVNVKYKRIWKCICAERVAIAKAVEANDLEFDAIVTVKYHPEEDEFEVINMCGECRQIAICHTPLNVISNNKGTIKVVSIEDIFPFPKCY